MDAVPNLPVLAGMAYGDFPLVRIPASASEAVKIVGERLFRALHYKHGTARTISRGNSTKWWRPHGKRPQSTLGYGSQRGPLVMRDPFFTWAIPRVQCTTPTNTYSIRKVGKEPNSLRPGAKYAQQGGIELGYPGTGREVDPSPAVPSI